MKSQTIRFQKMSTDIADKFMPEGVYKKMINCRPNNRNSKSGGVIENIPSTLAITPPAFNETVVYKGGCKDNKRSSIIAFYKGTSNTFVTSCNPKTKIEVIILKNSNSVINMTNRVTHCFVLDDFLFWIDSDFKVRRINVVKAAQAVVSNPSDVNYPAGYINVYSSAEMLIDKFPPLKPIISIIPWNNTAIVSNNITNSIFQFAYAWEYEDKEVSSWSPYSKSILPYTVDDKTYPNNAITLTIPTGSDKVTKIHLAYRKGINKDWVLSEILDKDKLAMSDNSNYSHEFYNTKLISGIVQADILSNTSNPFYQAETIALSKDNFAILGKIKDGLEKPKKQLSLTLTFTSLGTASKLGSYKYGATHEFGIVFRDENGRTDGVNARTEISIPFFTSAVDFGGSPMYSNVEFYGVGTGNSMYTNIYWTLSKGAAANWSDVIPAWAKTMSIVYLGNKTLSSFVNYTASGIQDSGIYTYIDITNLNSIRSSISSLDPTLQSSIISAYTFNKGDRIRFITNTSGGILHGDYDYEILGYVPEVTDSAGNVLFKDTIYVNIFNWDSLSIGKKSVFEIYTPKKELADNIFLEIGDVIDVISSTPSSLTGVADDGDVYSFNRDMKLYSVGELTAETTQQYEYTNNDDKNKSISIGLNVVTPDTGVQSVTNSSKDWAEKSFFINKNTYQTTVIVSGSFDLTVNTDDGCTLRMDTFNSAGTLLSSQILASAPNTSGGRDTKFKGTFSYTKTLAVGSMIRMWINNNHFIRIKPPVYMNVIIKQYETAAGSSLNTFVESRNYSDYYDSDEHSYGRPYVEIPDEDTNWKNNIVYTGKYFSDTDINDLNRIDPLNTRYVPYEHGFITAMRVKGDTLKVFTASKEISFYLGKEQYVDGSGEKRFALSSNAIGTINVYDSDYGVENPESLLETAGSIYYYDRKNATIVRTSNNGQADIGEYGLKTYLREVTGRINSAVNNSVFIGYNDKNTEVIVCFVIDGVPETVVLKESENAWTHFLDYKDGSNNAPQGMCNYGENLIVYKGGNGFLNEQGTTRNVFFGHAKSSTIEAVFNQDLIRTKILQSISHQGVGDWKFYITTPESEGHPYGMYTYIPKERFKRKENTFYSDVTYNLRNKAGVDSNIGYANGYPMRGEVANITMVNSAETAIRLDELTVAYIPS